MPTVDLSPTVRRVVYQIAAVLGLCFAGARVWLFTMGQEAPRELTAAEAVFGVLVTGLGIMAASNTPRTQAAQDAARELDAIGGSDPRPTYGNGYSARPTGEPLGPPPSTPSATSRGADGRRYRDDDGDGQPDTTGDDR